MTGILWLAPIPPIAVPARYRNTQAQRLTLAYGVERSPYADIIGLPVTIAIVSEAWNGENQALRAIIPNWLPCQNQNPHISVSWVYSSAPVKSNVMLSSQHQEEPFEAIAHCLVEFVEWAPKQSSPKTWKNSALRQCQHIWKTGDRKGQQCDELTRRSGGYCTRHRPKETHSAIAFW